MNYQLPHHKLQAYGVALRLLEAVRDARIRDCHLRDQAMRAAKSACLNAAEGAGRVTRADKARGFTIARAEACEACAAGEIAVAAGAGPGWWLEAVLAPGRGFVAMTTGFIRGPAARDRESRAARSTVAVR